MKVEKKIEIKSTPENLYNLIADGENSVKWNPTLNEVIEKEEGQKYLLKSDVGDILIVDTESVENKHITWHMENSDMDAIGFIVEPKGSMTEVTIWSEFEEKKLRKGYEKVAEMVLKGLKNYADFLEDGGDPEDFDKRQLMISP